MTCPRCGAYGDPDPWTGDDSDALCPACRAVEQEELPPSPTPAPIDDEPLTDAEVPF